MLLGKQAEERLAGTRYEPVFRESFGGVFSNELSAGEGAHRSERTELFFFLSVEVGNGKHTLEASLAAFVAAEEVEYSWEVSDAAGTLQALPTTKRTLVKTLPTYLIFHLRRYSSKTADRYWSIPFHMYLSADSTLTTRRVS